LAPIKLSLFFFIVLGLLSSCGSLTEQDHQAVYEALADSLERDSETWGVRMDIMEDGLRQISIKSPYATTLEKQTGSETTLYGPVFIEVVDSTGLVETTVTANKALYIARTGEFTFTKDVVVKTSGSKTLKTEELVWFQHYREIETPAFVVITTPQDSIAGFGLIGDDRLETYTILQVTGSITIETGGSNKPDTTRSNTQNP
jgi:LPS export ABC transporter protein LptC